MDLTDFTKPNSDYESDFENVSEEIDESKQENQISDEEKTQAEDIEMSEITSDKTMEQQKSSQLSKEEQDYINQQIQEQSLMQLGKTLHLTETNKKDFNQKYEDYQKVVNNLNLTPPEKCSPNNFDIIQIEKWFEDHNKSSDVLLFNDSSSYSNFDDHTFLTLYLLNKMNLYLIDKKEKDRFDQENYAKDMEEQSEQYFKEIEEAEKEKKEFENKMAIRITKLRDKCVYRNQQIYYMWLLISFLVYTTIMTWQYTYGQFEYLIKGMIMPFISLIFLNIANLIEFLFPLILEYNILPVLLGVIIGSIFVKVFY